jgi:acetyl esterase/lipase
MDVSGFGLPYRFRSAGTGVLLAVGGLCACATPRQTVADKPPTPAARAMFTFAEVAATVAPAAEHREAYGSGPLQFGELRLPPGVTRRLPVVVFIHGGCWRAAYDLAHVAAAADALVKVGYAVWVPEYRRVGDDGGGFPGTFDDVAAAVDHVRVLAAKYPVLDTTRAVVAGHSAGAQLALWAASRRANDAPSGLAASRTPLRVAGVVSLAGITDLATYGAAAGNCNSAVTPLLGGTPAQVAERYAAVSPIERLPIGAPVQIVHGAEDPIVPVAQSRDFAARSKQAGASVTLTEVPGAGHFDLVAPQSSAWPSVVAAIRALTPPFR